MICVWGALPCCAIWGGRERRASAREDERRDHYKGIRKGSEKATDEGGEGGGKRGRGKRGMEENNKKGG